MCGMKVLQISPYADPTIGGQEKHVLNLSKTLASLGHEVTIFTCRYRSPNNSKNFRVYEVRSKGLLGLRLISMKELAHFLSKNSFDIVHLHYETLFGETILLTNKICKLPTVTTLHSQMIRSLPARFIYDRISLRFISIISRKVICLTPKIMQDLVRRGLDPYKCVIIPNAIDVESLKIQFKKIQKELPEHEFDLLFVGRLEQRKGIKWLLQSLILLHKKGKKVTLKIVGRGPLENEIHRIISANSLQKYVNLLRYIPEKDLLKLFLLTKCVVVPSLYEGVPGVALEAMVANKPLIVTSIPGLSELVVNGGNGLIVNPFDIHGLASAIDRILTTPNYLSSLGDVNDEILRKYDWKIVAHKILETYHKALDDS